MPEPLNPAAAVTVAYDQYADAIFRHCYFRVHQREHAKDLVQETFTRTWLYLQSGKTIDNMRAFLYRVANNLTIDESRKHREASLEAMSEQGFTPTAKDEQPAVERHIDLELALTVLQDLPDTYREVITFRYVDELTPQEIAEVTGETPNAVSVRLHRALAAAQKLLQSTQNNEFATNL